MFDLKKTGIAAVGALFLTVSGAYAATCTPDSTPDVSGTDGGSLYGGSGDPADYVFVEAKGDGSVGSCWTDDDITGEDSAAKFSAVLPGIEAIIKLTPTGTLDEDYDLLDGLDTSDFSLSGADATGGTASIGSDVFDMFARVFLIFKDGNAEPAPTVAYEVFEGTTAGETFDYVSMFFGDDAGTKYKRDAISNITLAGIKGDLPPGSGDIPLPAAAWLLIGGMGILGGMKRFGRKA